MRERRNIFVLAFRVTTACVALVGMVLLLLPGIARGLGRPSEFVPWAFARPDDAPSSPRHVLADAGLRVDRQQWRRNRLRWSEMEPAERREMLSRYSRLHSGDEVDRARLVERYEALREMDRARREALRRQAAALARFEASLSRQDLAMLDSLTPRRRAEHLIKLWRSSRGLQ